MNKENEANVIHDVKSNINMNINQNDLVEMLIDEQLDELEQNIVVCEKNL